MKTTIAQINYKVGDFDRNKEKILHAYRDAVKQGADLVVFAEMAITGYPCEDLLLKLEFQDKAIATLHEILYETKGLETSILIGGVYREKTIAKSLPHEKTCFNACFLLEDGKIVQTITKHNLPDYSVFDEHRVFLQGKPNLAPIEIKGQKVLILICEDLWISKYLDRFKGQDIDLIICINASPYTTIKHKQRDDVSFYATKKLNAPLLYVNQVGGTDEEVFDGGSFVVSQQGNKLLQLLYWEEDLQTFELDKLDPIALQHKDSLFHIYNACVLGLRDYVRKNFFEKVLLGISGGIDSAIVAKIAVDALGSENVFGITMPSKFTSDETMMDSSDLISNLGINVDNIPIQNCVDAMEETLAPLFIGKDRDITEENIQSRMRGVVLMGISNKFNYLLLSTGNKSENATGYTTLYGDLCGGFNPIKDIYKTKLYELAEWINKDGEIIPKNIIEKEPTAELREGQKDTDTLPEYKTLDGILEMLIEKRSSLDDIIAAGYKPDVVRTIAKMFYKSEYKRKQAPIGVKITDLAFGKDRRVPVTHDD